MSKEQTWYWIDKKKLEQNDVQGFQSRSHNVAARSAPASGAGSPAEGTGGAAQAVMDTAATAAVGPGAARVLMAGPPQWCLGTEGEMGEGGFTRKTTYSRRKFDIIDHKK